MTFLKFFKALLAAEIVKLSLSAIDNGLFLWNVGAANRIFYKLICYRGKFLLGLWPAPWPKDARDVPLKEIVNDKDNNEKKNEPLQLKFL